MLLAHIVIQHKVAVGDMILARGGKVNGKGVPGAGKTPQHFRLSVPRGVRHLTGASEISGYPAHQMFNATGLAGRDQFGILSVESDELTATLFLHPSYSTLTILSALAAMCLPTDNSPGMLNRPDQS